MENDFLTHLIQETFSENSQTEEQANVVSLEDYFSLKQKNLQGYQTLDYVTLNSFESDFIQTKKFEGNFGRYLPSVHAFRFRINNQLVDFPENWSIFSTLKSCINENHQMIFAFNLDQDRDSLGHVFNAQSGALCFYFNDGLFSVFNLNQIELENLQKKSSPKAA